ncbi:MAG TPA: flavodoxin [Planococcus sp. (in: firmicutes)]|nr:flavodoxin [Planococcus sp. (in: firmicutes)]
MKIGIIVHSQTGHTLLVGERLREKLQSDGHEVTLLRFQNTEIPTGPQKPEDIKLDHIPDANGYDALIFGAWVQAFNLCPGFTLYLKQIPDFDTNNVSCFLTQQFRYKWMGGGLALSKMKKRLTAKGAKINASGVINWSNKKREQQIDDLVARFSRQYQV